MSSNTVAYLSQNTNSFDCHNIHQAQAVSPSFCLPVYLCRSLCCNKQQKMIDLAGSLMAGGITRSVDDGGELYCLTVMRLNESLYQSAHGGSGFA